MNTCRRQDFLMNTDVGQFVLSANAAEVASAAKDEIERLEKLLSFFLPDSDISRINKFAGVRGVSVSYETMEVLKAAVYVAEISDSAFDITFIKDGYKNLILDAENKTAFLRERGQRINVGAIGKGYAADRCLKIYQNFGASSAFVNLGGNAAVFGNALFGGLWSVGLRHPDKEKDAIFGAVEIASGQSVVTSGEYERGKHIIDPATGRPAKSDLKSVSVVCKSSMLADALSTAAFVSGLQKGAELIYKIAADAVFFTADNEVYITESLRGYFKLQKDCGLECYVYNRPKGVPINSI